MESFTKFLGELATMFAANAGETDPSRTDRPEVPDDIQAAAYAKRNVNVYLALGFAAAFGFPCGIRQNLDEPDWPIVYIELPTGQVSWHMPQYGGAVDPWDGHSVEEKYRRIDTARRNKGNA